MKFVKSSSARVPNGAGQNSYFLREIIASSDNSRKKHTEYARYNQDTEENISEEKGSVTKNKRGKTF